MSDQKESNGNRRLRRWLFFWAGLTAIVAISTNLTGIATFFWGDVNAQKANELNIRTIYVTIDHPETLIEIASGKLPSDLSPEKGYIIPTEATKTLNFLRPDLLEYCGINKRASSGESSAVQAPVGIMCATSYILGDNGDFDNGNSEFEFSQEDARPLSEIDIARYFRVCAPEHTFTVYNDEADRALRSEFFGLFPNEQKSPALCSDLSAQRSA